MYPIEELVHLSKQLDILYVEDDKDIRGQYTKIFKKLFNFVDTAEDGEIGLNKYKSHPFDLVITDILMPNIDGIEMLTQIRKINSKQMVIVLSGCTEAEYLMPLIEEGIYKFIMKPVDTPKLLSTIHKTCILLSEQKEGQEYQMLLERENINYFKKIQEFQTENKRQNGKRDSTVVLINSDLKNRIDYISNMEGLPKIEIKKSKDINLNQTYNLLDEDDLDDLEDYLYKLYSLCEKMKVDGYDPIIYNNFLLNIQVMKNILIQVNEFFDIASGLEHLCFTFKHYQNSGIDDSSELHPLFVGLINDFILWKNMLFYEGSPSINFMDASILVNIKIIINLLDPREVSVGNIDDIFNF